MTGPVPPRHARTASVVRAAWMLGLLATVAGAAESVPPPGSAGFDWLRPGSARCTALTAELGARLKPCRVSANPFGLDMKAWVCRIDRRSEYFFFATPAQCRTALETMQANAP